MASRWIDVTLVQSEPTDLGLDSSSRQVFAFNILVTKEVSATFDGEITSVLTGAGVNTAQIFRSSHAQLPVGDGPYLTIRLTGGPAGIRVHNVTSGPKYRQSTAQLVATAKTKAAALAMAETAMAALAAVKDQTVA